MTDQHTFPPTVAVPTTLPPPPPGWSDSETAAPLAARAVPAKRKRRVRRRDRRRWEQVGLVLTGVGVLLLLFLAYLYVFTPLTYARNQHRLLQGLVGNPRSVYRLVSGKLPPDGSALGVLTLPSLHQREVFVRGTSAADLQDGPGLMAGTVLPGDAGNAVIAGRRATYGGPFASIDSLRLGDHIKVVDGAGIFTFTVTERRLLAGGQDDMVGVRGQRWLTLVTSNASLTSSGYDVVVAKATASDQPPGRHALSTHSLTLTGLGGDPAAGILAGAWSLVFLLGLGATVYLIRRWRRAWQTYVLAVPILLTCGLFACESLARCLPATL